MAKVKCIHAAGNCPSSCPHRKEHEESDICQPSICSFKNLKVKCEKPFRRQDD